MLSALLLTFVILLGVIMTFIVSKLLSLTVLKGVPSNFTLELPPYRKPQILSIVIRSIFDRTIFVLGRAVIVSIPAGAIIWLMANFYIGDKTLIIYITNFLNPFASLMGIDGIILMAFILGFPANEVVIPIIIMGYMGSNSLMDINDLNELKNLLISNGWTINTAICTILFSLFHWPCSTACLTIQKETKSFKYTFLSFIIPTLIGIAMCMIVTLFFKLTHI